MDDDLNRILHDAQKSVQGEFPRGRLNDADQGAMACAITIENNAVVLRFAHPTTWIGLPKDIALKLSESLARYAEKLP